MLHSFLPFIFELKSVPSRIGSIHHWQLVRYMTHKDIPFGAVVNFNQSERGALEVQFIVRQEGTHWLYDPAAQTGRPLVDFAMALAAPVAASSGASGSGASGSGASSVVSGTSDATQVDEWAWPGEE